MSRKDKYGTKSLEIRTSRYFLNGKGILENLTKSDEL